MFVKVRFNKPDLTTPYPPTLVMPCAPEFMAGVAPCRRSSENTPEADFGEVRFYDLR